MDDPDKQRPTAPFHLENTLKCFKKDSWKFGVVLVYAAVFLGAIYLLKM